MAFQHTLSTFLTIAALSIPILHAEPRLAATAPILTLLVDNYAAIQTDTLESAMESARRIYQRAGVESRWIDCGTRSAGEVAPPMCETLGSPEVIRVRIMPTLKKGFNGVGRLVYGYAVPSNSGGFGWAATVFQDRVATKAKAHDLAVAALLGSVMAHEAGHLLLGRNSHSSYGLMSSDWTRAELQKIGEGALIFVGGEKTRIKQAVEARLAAAPSLE